MGNPKVLLIVTQDTKEQEAQYIRAILEGAGCDVIHRITNHRVLSHVQGT